MTHDDPAPAPRVCAAPAWARWVKPRRVLPILALVFGLSLVFLTAPFQAPDEPAHFYRAFQISQGQFLPVYVDHHGGGDLPDSLEDVARRFAHVQSPGNSARSGAIHKVSLAEIAQARQVTLDPRRHHFTRFVSAIYSPASYLPQAGTIFVGRKLGLGPLALMYAGRVGNLVVWIFLSYLALRIAPTCRRPLLLLLLMPMTLFQAASLSADPTSNALAVLLAAMVLRYVDMDGAGASPRIGFAACVAFALLASTLALTKFVYLPLLALVLLILPSRLGGTRRYLVAVAVLCLLSLVAFLAWTTQTRGLETAVSDKPGVNPAGQLLFLRTHPAHVWTLLTSTLAHDGWGIVHSFVGRLGWLDAPMSHFFTNGYLIVLFAACWLQKERSSFSRRLCIVATAVPVLISIVLIALLNYLYTMPMGDRVAGGIQGRYLIPLAPAVILLLWRAAPRRLTHSARELDAKLNLGVAVIVSFSCIYTLVTVWIRYYGRAV